jgi:hypothetical protein
MPTTPTAPPRSALAVLRTVLITLALLGYGLAASSHDHDAPRAPDDGLCAICVYGTGAGATLQSVAATAPQPLPERCPHALAPGSVTCRLVSSLAIRGPPRVA